MVQIPVGQYYSPTSVASGGVAFQPLLAGSTDVSATIPGFIATAQATRTAVVSQPGIGVVVSYNLGSGLQDYSAGYDYVSLGAANHGGVTVTLTSSDQAVALLSPDGVTPGAGSINVPVANGTSFFYFRVQGVEGQTGTVTITAAAAGFSNGTTTATVVPPAVELQGVPSSTTTLSGPTPFYAQVGLPNGNNTGLSVVQSVRAGAPGPLTVTVTSSVPAVGTLVVTAGPGSPQTVQIPVGQYYSPTSVASGGVAFRPLSIGSTVVAVNIPGFIQMITNGVRTVTVN